MAIILDNKKSTYGNPYAYYTLETTNIGNRTATTVDIAFKITSHLANSSSVFGTGGNRYLKAQLYIKDAWSQELTIKTTSDTWKGTTNHTYPFTLTIENLKSTDTTLENIKFKVKSGASDQSCGLNATACSNIEIPIGHTPPLVTGFTTQEMNPLLSGVSSNTIVENLSILRFIVNYELYDNASVLRTGIYNNIYPYTTNNFTLVTPTQLTFDLDCSQINFYVDDNKIPIVTRVIDSFETQGVSSPLSQSTMFNRIPYVKPYILEANTKAQRIGQTSGQVGLTVIGGFYSGIIGNVNQKYSETEDTEFESNKKYYVLNNNEYVLLENGTDYNTGDSIENYYTTVYELYKPTISYRAWEYGNTNGASQSEENPILGVIPAANVTVNNDGTFKVDNYDIGSSNDQDTNWFNPEKAYRIKIKVVDSFTEYESSELSIPVGESIWDEHKDHVDFKKLTVKENDIYNELFHSNGDILELGANSGDERYCINGFITVSTTTLLFNIHTDKSMKDINTITCLELNVESRGINGYLNSTSGYVDYVGLSGYTINCYKVDNHNIRVAVKKSSAFTNTTNNTPISLNGYFKFELSYVE